MLSGPLSPRLIPLGASSKAPYRAKVLGLSPLAYFECVETSGTTMTDSSGNGYNGTWNAVTLADADGPGPSMGKAPKFNGTSSYGRSTAAGLLAALSKTVGTLSIWCKVASSGVWTDGIGRVGIEALIDASNRMYNTKAAANNTARGFYQTSGSLHTAEKTSYSNTNWFHVLVTFDTAANNSLYLDNVLAQATAITATVTGSFASVMIGAADTTPANVWSGWLCHAALFARVVTANERNILATAN